MAEASRRAFVCGHPIAHSRSPKIHGFWLEKYGISGRYGAVDVSPEHFPAFLRGFPRDGYAGGNVPIPHKEDAFRLVDRRDEAAEAIGAVNTLWVEDGTICGGNTDWYGFAANLDDHAPGWDIVGPALVLGAGGAARGIVHALQKRGFSDIRIANRTVSRSRQLADHFGAGVSAHPLEATPELMRDAGLLVNTTSLGMHGEQDLPGDLSALPASAVVADIVYVPLETPLLAAARRCGLKTVDGLGMLLHQAVPGFERWFGTRPEVDAALRERIVADLGIGK